MFVLGRWSGTGLFPLFCDMVADTMDHIETNRDSLKGFTNPYWYKGGSFGGKGPNWPGSIDSGYVYGFSEKLTKAYEEGWLFNFLRGESRAELAEEASV